MEQLTGLEDGSGTPQGQQLAQRVQEVKTYRGGARKRRAWLEIAQASQQSEQGVFHAQAGRVGGCLWPWGHLREWLWWLWEEKRGQELRMRRVFVGGQRVGRGVGWVPANLRQEPILGGGFLCRSPGKGGSHDVWWRSTRGEHFSCRSRSVREKGDFFDTPILETGGFGWRRGQFGKQGVLFFLCLWRQCFTEPGACVPLATGRVREHRMRGDYGRISGRGPAFVEKGDPVRPTVPTRPWAAAGAAPSTRMSRKSGRNCCANPAR